MGRTLQRNLGPVTALTAAQWTDQTAGGDPAVCCPSCGRVADLDLRVIHGNVIGRWRCPYEDCTFQDWLSLEAWAEEVLR